jgi:hypothetical protein
MRSTSSVRVLIVIAVVFLALLVVMQLLGIGFVA